MHDLLQQFRVALRSLRRSPVHFLTATVTLALGVAALVAVFSVVDAVLLRPLDYERPDELVAVWETGPPGTPEAWRVDGATFSTWRASDVFSRTAAFGFLGGTLTGGGQPRVLRGSRVTSDYFSTLGVAPRLGRLFGPADVAADRLAVLGHGLWRERFDGADDAIGRTLVVDGSAYTVIGVAPDGLYPTSPVNGPRMHFRRESQDLWLLLPETRLAESRSHVLGVVARLSPGGTPESAGAALARLATGPGGSFAGAVVRPLVDEAVGDVRRPLAFLLGAAALVLLAAVANVGGLQLARALAGRHELAVRRALGADLGSLVRRQVAEALIVAATAALAGAALAAAALPRLLAWVPRDVPRLDEAQIDPRALSVAIAVTLVATCGLALVGLIETRRAAPADAMREGGRVGESVGRQRLGQILVAAQIALAVALASTAALFVESLRRLEADPLGVTTDRLLVVDLELPESRYRDAHAVAGFYRELLDRVAALPDVEAAHLVYDHPLETNWLDSFALVGRPPSDDTAWTAELRFATPGLFVDLDVPVLAGRELEATDRAGRRPVALVNRAFARRFFAGDSPLGATLRTAVATYTWGEGAPTEFEIVGVVGDVATPGIDRAAEPAFFVSVWQVPQPALKLLVRTAGAPEAAMPPIRALLAELDRELPLGGSRSLEHERRRAVAQPRFSMRLLGLFGAAALALAALGIYGLLAGWVTGRRRELAVRGALGARRGALLGLVLRRGLQLAAVGAVSGALSALALARALAGQLYGVTPSHLGAYLTAGAVVLVTALAACLLPALRATAVDPAAALRES